MLGFILISALWVLLYRFVAPPITLTQLFDGNGDHARMACRSSGSTATWSAP